MDFNSLTLSPIFEKSLIRLVADFGSDLDPKSASSSLSKSLNIQISSKEPSKFSYQLTRTSDGVYHFTTSFILHKNARLVIINFLQWIAKNGFTKDDNSFLIDLKFVDKEEGPFKGTLFNTSTKIDNINKLKFLLEFDENKMYNKFPNRKYGFISKTINNFTPLQKFIPKESDIIEDIDFVGIVNSYREVTTKKGDRMAYITLEDTNGIIEAIIFPDLLSKNISILKSDKPLVVNGSVEKLEDGTAKIRAKNITLLEDITREMDKMVTIKVNCEIFKKDDLKKLKDVLFSIKGKSKVSIELRLNGEKSLIHVQDMRIDHNKLHILLKHFPEGIKYDEVTDEILS